MVVEESQCRAAHECEICHDFGLPASCPVLTPNRIPTPMVAVFHPSPVSPDQVDPPLFRPFTPVLTGKVVTGFEALFARLLDGSPTLDCHHGAGEGEVHAHRLNLAQDQPAFIDPPVADLGLEQRGVPGHTADWRIHAVSFGFP